MSDFAPSTLILLLLATASASLAHLLWGRRWRHLLLFWMTAFFGCLLVYAVRLRLPIDLPMPAGVPVLEAVLAAWLLLIVAARLRV